MTEPPEIYKFVFAGEPELGKEYTVHCIIVGGDSPIYLSWYKDGDLVNPAETASSPQKGKMEQWKSPTKRAPRSYDFDLQLCQDDNVGYNFDDQFSVDLKSAAYNDDQVFYSDSITASSDRKGISALDYLSINKSHSEKENNYWGKKQFYSRNKEVGSAVDPRIIVNQLGDRYSELHFSLLCPHHTGNYTCMAHNNVGMRSYSEVLNVKGKFNCVDETHGSKIN